MNKDGIVYSFAWYQPDQWQRLKEVVDDPSSLDDTYQQWKHSAENAITEMRSNGHVVCKISINIDELLVWCDAKGIRPDSSARSEFAAMLAQERDAKHSKG